MEEIRKKTAAVISFTSRGEALSRRIILHLQETGYSCIGYRKTSQYKVNQQESNPFKTAASENIQPKPPLHPVSQSLCEWTREQFSLSEVIIFVGAAGIAVRGVAPWIKDKYTDPAVLVVDEMGKFVIPILSGHIGGANAVASLLAGFLYATPVITTATDLHGCFAADIFARKNGMWISDRDLAKRVSAEILEGNPVGLFSDFLLKEEIPGCFPGKAGKANLYIGVWEREKWRDEIPVENTLQLVPKAVMLGVGCRKDIAPEVFKEQVKRGLNEWGIRLQAVKAMASIAVKKEEKAIKELCREMNWEMCWFSAGELAEAEGDFSYSAFVEQTVGVGNVCERAAVLGAGGPLIQKKKVLEGVTLAAAFLGEYNLKIPEIFFK